MENMERTTFIPIPASPDVYVHASEQPEHTRIQPIGHNSSNRVHPTVTPSSGSPETEPDEVVRIDNGDEYTLIPLGNDMFQVFKTADLVFNHIVIERQDTPDQLINHKENVFVTAESATDGRHFIHTVPQTLYSNGAPHQEVFPARAVHNYPTDSSVEEVLPSSDSRPVQRPKRKNTPTNKPKKTEEKKETAPIIFACRICDVTFSNEFSLDAHVQQHQIWKEKPDNSR